MRAHDDAIASNARYQTRSAIDTGQADHARGVNHGVASCRLSVLDHEVHRTDEGPNHGSVETVMSTLKGFVLRVGLVDGRGTLCDREDGLSLQAALVYENGRVVEETSATHEPPLLGGEAILHNGEANFKLRITVLSSLCRSKFRIQVTANDRPNLGVITSSMRTITKLRRAPKDKGVNELDFLSPIVGNKRLPEWDLNYVTKHFVIDELETRSTSTIWEEISSNSERLVDLQRQQALLFQELRTTQNVG